MVQVRYPSATSKRIIKILKLQVCHAIKILLNEALRAKGK